MTHIGGCTGKKYYPSLRSANRFADRFNAAFETKPPQRSYECKHCRGWHLTSVQPLVATDVDDGSRFVPSG